MTERNTIDPPKLRAARPTPTGPTTEPPEARTGEGVAQRLVDRLSSVPALTRQAARDLTMGAAQRVADRAVDSLSSNAEFMRTVGIGCVSLAILYWLLHGFLGFFPEARYLETLGEVRRLETELKDARADLVRTRAAWIECLNGGDGDASGEEVR